MIIIMLTMHDDNKFILPYADLFQKSLDYKLYDAAVRGDVGAVEKLLDEGADIECRGPVSEVVIIHLLIFV